LLGEDLIAFRDTKGAIGLLDSLCPHRLAPLAFGRNEECGIRCVYHGWKFDVNGQAVDIPAEPNKHVVERIRAKSYRCQERNGLIWAYMGPNQDSPPPLPNFEWNLVPENQVHLSFRVQETNWLQALEGDIDSAHASFLHTRTDAQGVMGQLTLMEDTCPKFEVVREPFGLNIGSTRNKSDGDLYVRVNQFAFPFYAFNGPQAKYPEMSGHAWTPIDDEHVLAISISWHPDQPLNPRTVEIYKNGFQGLETGHPSKLAFVSDDAAKPFQKYWTKYNNSTNFYFDYARQQDNYFCGIPGLWTQDVACQMAMPISDRTREHLLSSDKGIVMTRRVLLEQARQYEKSGEMPASVTDPDLMMIRPGSLTLKPQDDWKDSRATHLRARLGTGFGYVP
jgi:phenylpropionate dioxygenase-like ring-hydroxylating dioxygenase large terminal subunit